MVAFVFPGQGAQTVGMGQQFYEEFPIARQTFEEVDDVLNQKLSKIIFEGPATDLTQTSNAQPAIMAVGLAIFRVLVNECGIDIKRLIKAYAGHSLGEYAALTAADSLTLADCARLLRIRGDAMQRAVPQGQGMMAAVLGLELEELALITQQATEGVCEIANDNCNGQIVISGHVAAVEAAMQQAKEKGARRCIPLTVSAPFHCSLMAPAAERMAQALADIGFKEPAVPIICNVTAQPESNPLKLRDNLVAQIAGKVRWRESISQLRSQRIQATVEIGPGQVLTNLINRIDPDLVTLNVQTVRDIEGIKTYIKKREQCSI